MTLIKLCGIKDLPTIHLINQLEVTAVGFIQVKKSPRYLTPDTTKRLCQALSPHLKAVGVFANHPMEEVIRLTRFCGFDLIQLHGKENQAYIDQLRSKLDLPIIKACAIQSPNDLASAQQFDVDYLLLDAPSAGSGQVFDWRLLQHFDRPYFLAGGLTVSTIEQAIHQVHPYGVDVSSGIERNGQKDPDLIRQFVSQVHQADQTPNPQLFS